MKFYKIMFLNFLILGTLISISSYSWLSMWMGLEINMISFIPLISKKKDLKSSESTMKYFIIQSISSMLILMAALIMVFYNEFVPPMNSLILIMNSAFLMKLGAAPFHFWFPEVMEGLSWINCFILMTWQKISPFMLIMNNKAWNNLIIVVIFFCLLISVIMSFNQISLRKILTFSSINNIAWMLASLQCSYSIWLMYFILYSFMNLPLMIMFNSMSMNYLNQMLNFTQKSFLMKLFLIVNFFSLGGLPPFIGFLPKWLVIYSLSLQNLEFLSFLLIVMTLILLYVYIRMVFFSLTFMSTESKVVIKFESKLFVILSFMMLVLLIFMTLIFNLI
uniref:NADH dehydrogenase subunit 2 n=1 Tax=Lagria rufipennis TaxID=1738060 RepID=UPI002176C85C|nr:NADH dehydrogenase subunit 2 [Lagria rufipennis]UUL71639.1 NADH dehydrogenase subunit 2 [Lagria rufipennis]